MHLYSLDNEGWNNDPGKEVIINTYLVDPPGITGIYDTKENFYRQRKRQRDSAAFASAVCINLFQKCKYHHTLRLLIFIYVDSYADVHINP